MIYPDYMSAEDIALFEREFAEWSAEEELVAAREREFLANNPVDVSEEMYSPYWGA